MRRPSLLTLWYERKTIASSHTQLPEHMQTPNRSALSKTTNSFAGEETLGLSANNEGLLARYRVLVPCLITTFSFLGSKPTPVPYFTIRLSRTKNYFMDCLYFLCSCTLLTLRVKGFNELYWITLVEVSFASSVSAAERAVDRVCLIECEIDRPTIFHCRF